MSNTANGKIQSYLETCYQEVIMKALRNGLDYEALYRYLQEMLLALPKDHPLAAQYENGMVDAQARMLLTEVDIETATTWVFSCTGIMDKQLVLLTDLMAFIEDHEDEEVTPICEAQLNFIKQTLWLQRRVLDTILAWAPSHIILHVEGESAKEYAETLGHYAKVKARYDAVASKRAKDDENN